MGIDLNCGDEYFSCRYSAWKYLRYTLIAEKVLEVVPRFTEKGTEDLFYYDLHSLFKEYNDLMTKDFTDNIKLIMETSKNITLILLEHEDYLKSFEMDGVVFLINKSDCSGEYTVKESERILNTIKNIRKNINDENDHKDVYDRLIKLFEESVNKNISVTIS